MQTYDRGTLKNLIQGNLPWATLKNMMSAFKDPNRFSDLLSIMQESLQWDDRILIPYALHLYVVEKADKRRVIKCDCGHEFCDVKENWKLHAKIYICDTEEKMTEIYPKLMGCDTDWMVLRHYYCPSCLTQLEVEAVPPGYPIIHDFEPDIDTFYREWLGKPLKD